MHHCFTKALATLTAAAITLLPAGPAFAVEGGTATPIKHVVVIFQENVSFDHYFGTYPNAQKNTDGARYFRGAKENMPRANTLESAGLLTNNPNGVHPFRIDRSNANTCDENHTYQDEQFAFHGGLMDRFTGIAPSNGKPFSCNDKNIGANSVMGYYDGNTVTAFWNYAQHFAMSDNSFGTTFGPSTPGLLNLVSGTTYPATPSAPQAKIVPNNAGPGTLVGDLDPTGDVCSAGTTVRLGNPTEANNICDLLSAKGVTWGAFMGGFDLTVTNPNGTTGCNRSSPATAANGGPTKDYIPHHAFFQYYQSTVNPSHTRPGSITRSEE